MKISTVLQYCTIDFRFLDINLKRAHDHVVGEE